MGYLHQIPQQRYWTRSQAAHNHRCLMNRFIWRKIIVPSLLFTSILYVVITLKSLIDTKETLIFPSEKLKGILKKSEDLNIKRRLRIEEVCKKYNLGKYKSSNSTSSFKYPPTPQYSVFYFDQSHNIAYCPTFKAGSTTWLYNLLFLNGINYDNIKGKIISDVAREIFPQLDGETAEHRLLQSKSLLSVRHPFERILSAYRDKLEDKNRAPEHGTFHFYKRWGSKIRNKYRSSGKLEPTFEEFVRYLIETNLLLYADDHWIPYNAYCTPCHVRYDFVAAVETLTEDQLFFIHNLHLPSWLTPTRRHSSARISSDVAKDYFSELTKDQLFKLYEKFRLDFEMFDYSIAPYLQFVKNSSFVKINMLR